MRWLDYHKGELKIVLVLACGIAAILIGLFGYSPLPGVLISLASAVIVVAALAILQRQINEKYSATIRIENHPDLGTVKVFANHWQTDRRTEDTNQQFALVGDGRAASPTDQQLSLWRDIQSHFQSLIEAANAALSAQMNSVDPAMQPNNLRLTLIQLQTPDTFILFFLCPSRLATHPRGLYARYQRLTIIDAGWTPYKAKWRSS